MMYQNLPLCSAIPTLWELYHFLNLNWRMDGPDCTCSLLKGSTTKVILEWNLQVARLM